MVGLKVRMIISVAAAIALGFLLVGISYVIFPDQPAQMPTPKPAPDPLGELLSAILWIGLAAFLSLIIVGTVFLVNRIKNKNLTQKQIPYIMYFC